MAKGMLTGVVVGGAIGAVGALLLAPKTGPEMRKDLAERLSTMSDKTKSVAADVGQRTSELAKNIGSQTSGIVGMAKDATQGVMSEVKSWKSDVAETAAEAVNESGSGSTTGSSSSQSSYDSTTHNTGIRSNPTHS
ncbi:hypothetical protein J31TS4_33060 [Paenibacillus sp. J31TS4]|uniref:YtxH domain-containing protein n=1 Tax=Paenibacillus sp. J31TS4 TaxID=2807195 RepID=UPI001B0A12D6|nr:YtxH domain-containing protein [Paenibacillus sp. J31TS4]GIP40026.1 hypothetical protein J31TS4_33060 [Paenibacillus sp. J31TS4]